jgi:hypothetical protein
MIIVMAHAHTDREGKRGEEGREEGRTEHTEKTK